MPAAVLINHAAAVGLANGRGGVVPVGIRVGNSAEVCGAGVGGTGKVARIASVGKGSGDAVAQPVKPRSTRNKKTKPRKGVWWGCGRETGAKWSEGDGSDISVREKHL